MQLASLDGFTVGITADRRWDEQAELLRRRGAAILHGPSIRTLPLGPEEGLRNATQDAIARPPDIVIANTGIGMRAWFGAAESWGLGEALIRSLSGARIFARGPKASGAVHQAGLHVEARAGSERLEEVIGLAIEAGVSGRRVAFQRHGAESPDELRPLCEAGADLLEIPVYQWVLPTDAKPAQRLIDAAIAHRIDAVTFTSAPAVRNLLDIAEEFDARDDLLAALNGPVLCACVGPVCAGAARQLGISDMLVPDKARLGPMIRALAEALAGRVRQLSLARHDVTLRGQVIEVDGERIELTDREAATFGRLAQRPGAVISKGELMATIWRDAKGDPHVVEVTVARLRRRLGAVGDAIVAVPRRGYRLDMAIVNDGLGRATIVRK